MSNKKSRNIKRKSKRNVGVRKYNKIVSTLVKNKKKRGEEYNIRDVQVYASSLYPNFKKVPLSRITQKAILSATPQPLLQTQRQQKKKDVITILSTDVPNHWFDQFINWWDIGTHIADFNNTYPEIPIVIKSPDNELAIKGKIGTYQGSELQDFVEKLREEFDNKSGIQLIGSPAWKKSKNKKFAFWGTEDVEFPKVPDFTDVTKEVKEEVEIREKDLEIKKKTKKKEEKPLPKTKKVPEKKEKKEPTGNLIKALELLSKDYDRGIYTKKEYKEERKILLDRFKGRGGTI